jgi:hypothetical protein
LLQKKALNMGEPLSALQRIPRRYSLRGLARRQLRTVIGMKAENRERELRDCFL